MSYGPSGVRRNLDDSRAECKMGWRGLTSSGDFEQVEVRYGEIFDFVKVRR